MGNAGFIVDFADIPDEWFLMRLRHKHIPIFFAGEKHRPKCWQAELQHRAGGPAEYGVGDTPEDALKDAISLVLKLNLGD